MHGRHHFEQVSGPSNQANNPSFRGLSHEQQETPNKSLDASGGSVFRNLIRPAMLD